MNLELVGTLNITDKIPTYVHALFRVLRTALDLWRVSCTYVYASHACKSTLCQSVHK